MITINIEIIMVVLMLLVLIMIVKALFDWLLGGKSKKVNKYALYTIVFFIAALIRHFNK